MKHLLKTAISLLLLGTALTGCVRETEINAPTPNGKTAVVTFNVKTPAPTVHRTRSQTTAETTISNIYVLLFDETGAYVDHKIAQTFSPATGTNTESDYQKFDATLPVGDYDIVLLANLNAALAAELATQVAESSPTKSSILNALVYTSAGNPDITNGFPMASLDKEVQEIAPGTASLEFTLIRMVARIDVGFSASNSALNNYTVEAVAFYNHNQKGNVWHGGLTAVPVTTTNIPTTTGKVDDSSYQVNNSGTTPAEKHSFEALLYALEAEMDGDDATRPCIVVKLSDGTNDLGWYRIDFKSTDGTYSDIIRNNRYIFTISQVTGSGFTDAETAYNAGPKNIVTEVVNWDETEYDNGIFNGVYSILFTGGREVSFSQFGKPESHVLKVKTNLPAITFNNFYESGMPDEEWDEITADQGEFTNEHFTVKIEKDGPDAAEYYTYMLTISAKAAKNADPGDENSSADYPRLTTFWISGDALSADFKVRQEGYENYKLLTETDHNPVSMTGAGGTFDIRVTTTHPYKVSLKPNTGMFAGVWGKDTETDTDVLYYDADGDWVPTESEGIPATVEVLTVHVGTYTPPADGSPRLGTVEISHVDTESTASGKQHYVMQVDPVITATTDKAELLASGAESATITVESNVPEWTPVLKEVWVGSTQVAEADMYNYVQALTPASGTYNGTVTFTPVANAEAKSVKFVIQIVSSDGVTYSDDVTVTQKSASAFTTWRSTKEPNTTISTCGSLGGLMHYSEYPEIDWATMHATITAKWPTWTSIKILGFTTARSDGITGICYLEPKVTDTSWSQVYSSGRINITSYTTTYYFRCRNDN